MGSLCSGNAYTHEWMAPKEFGEKKNPVQYGDMSITRGKEVYLDNCAACHGDHAEGLQAEEVSLKTGPPNLVKRLATHTDGDFFWKIQKGRGDMPSFEDDLGADEIWDVINFLRSIK